MKRQTVIDIVVIGLAILAVHLLGSAEPAAFVYQNF